MQTELHLRIPAMNALCLCYVAARKSLHSVLVHAWVPPCRRALCTHATRIQSLECIMSLVVSSDNVHVEVSDAVIG